MSVKSHEFGSLHEEIFIFHYAYGNIKESFYHSTSHIPLFPTLITTFFSHRTMECGNVEIRLIRAFQN